jgi:hypothetical protein
MKKNLLTTGLLILSLQAAIAQTGLIAHFPFSGNTNDIGPSALTGTINGPVTLTSDKASAPNMAYNFAGAGGSGNSYINLGYPSALSLGNSSASFSAWFRSYSMTSNANGALFNNASGYFTGIQFGLNYQGNSNIGVVVGGGGGPTTAAAIMSVSNPSINFGTWQHAVVVIDRAANRMRIYLDCVQQPIQKYTQFGTPSGTITGNDLDITGISLNLNPGLANSIGAYVISPTNVQNDFDGDIDEVMIFNKALTASEVCQLYATSIDEVKKNDASISIFPNPGNGIYTIRSKDQKNNTVKVFNSLGMLIKEENNFNDSHFTIDISDAPSGIYFIQVGSSRTKVIKQ